MIGPLRTSALIALLSTGAVACTTTTNVPVTSLQTIAHGDGTPTVVNATDGGIVRVDPNSTLRLRFRDGTSGAVVAARDLSSSPEGLFREVPISAGHASALTIAELDESDLVLAEQTKPDSGTVTHLAPGSARLEAVAADLPRWALRLMISLAKAHDPSTASRAESDAWQSAPCPAAIGTLLSPHSSKSTPSPWNAWWCTEDVTFGDAQALRAALATERGRKSLGAWTVIDGGHRSDPLRGRDLDALFVGTKARDGVGWDDIDSVDVTNVSGSKSLAMLAVTAGVGVALAPVAALAKGTGDFGGGPHRSNGRIYGDAKFLSASSSARDEGEHAPDEGRDRPQAISTVAPRPLFSSRTSRRAIARLSGSLEASGDAIQAGTISENAIVSLRLGDIFDIGGGVATIQTRSDSLHDASTVGLFRTGIHAWLDERRRFAIPLAVDLGSGGDVNLHARVVSGLRVGVTDSFEVSLYPVTPTWDSHRTLASRWTWQSGVGASMTFF